MTDETATIATQALVAATLMTEPELAAQLGLSAAAFERRKRKDGFSRADRAMLIRVALIVGYAERVLGSRARSMEWVRNSNNALHGNSPLAMLSTKAGTQRVVDVLARIGVGTLCLVPDEALLGRMSK